MPGFAPGTVLEVDGEIHKDSFWLRGAFAPSPIEGAAPVFLFWHCDYELQPP